MTRPDDGTAARMARLRARYPGKWTYGELGWEFGFTRHQARHAVSRARKNPFVERQCQALDHERRRFIGIATPIFQAVGRGDLPASALHQLEDV